MPPQKITPFLWFDGQAEEAANYYTAIFKNSGIDSIVPGPDGKTLLVGFHLGELKLVGLNGGPHFKFTEAISFAVDCEDQAEIDRLWETLTAEGEPSQCGWLKDKYGLSWQIVPAILPELMSDPQRAGAVMQALMQMIKLDIATLQAAYDEAE